jgi:hypothetical protein
MAARTIFLLLVLVVIIAAGGLYEQYLARQASCPNHHCTTAHP